MFCSDARSDYNFGFTKNSKTIDSEEQREASYSALIAWGQPTPPPLHLRGLLLVKARQQPTAQRPLMTVTPPASLSRLTGPASSGENGSPATPGCLLGMETIRLSEKVIGMHLSKEWINIACLHHGLLDQQQRKLIPGLCGRFCFKVKANLYK